MRENKISTLFLVSGYINCWLTPIYFSFVLHIILIISISRANDIHIMKSQLEYHRRRTKMRKRNWNLFNVNDVVVVVVGKVTFYHHFCKFLKFPQPGPTDLIIMMKITGDDSFVLCFKIDFNFRKSMSKHKTKIKNKWERCSICAKKIIEQKHVKNIYRARLNPLFYHFKI